MNARHVRNALFAALLIGFLYYAWRYIQATSFDIGGTRYYILFDDAMISMRYAYNLAHGNGLVWNVGERVQGFTNPLWVLYMAGLHLLPLEAGSDQPGGADHGRRSCWRRPCTLCAASWSTSLTTCRRCWRPWRSQHSTRPLNSYVFLGMEVSALALVLTAAVWIVLRNGTERFTPWLYVLLAVGTLLRSDAAVPYVIILAAQLILQKQFRGRNLAWGLGLLALCPRWPGCWRRTRTTVSGCPIPTT